MSQIPEDALAAASFYVFSKFGMNAGLGTTFLSDISRETRKYLEDKSGSGWNALEKLVYSAAVAFTMQKIHDVHRETYTGVPTNKYNALLKAARERAASFKENKPGAITAGYVNGKIRTFTSIKGKGKEFDPVIRSETKKCYRCRPAQYNQDAL